MSNQENLPMTINVDALKGSPARCGLNICVDPSIRLPNSTIVSKVGIVGMSGSGKTQTARKLAESMLSIQQHIGVLDPTGAWWGLRSSADGLNPGYPIVVFGAHHADAPLKADSGKMLAAAKAKGLIQPASRSRNPALRRGMGVLNNVTREQLFQRITQARNQRRKLPATQVNR